MARANVLAPVLRVLRDRAGQLLYVDELAATTGFTEQQVKHALANARAVGSAAVRDVEYVISGTAWRYGGEPPTQPSDVGDAVVSNDVIRETDDDDDDDDDGDGYDDVTTWSGNGHVEVDRLRFEEVGRTGTGVLLVREVDRPDGPVYRLEEVR